MEFVDVRTGDLNDMRPLTGGEEENKDLSKTS